MQLRLLSCSSLLALALIPCLSACPSSEEGEGEEVGETGTTDESGESESTDDESSDDQGSSESAETDSTGMEETAEDVGTEDTGTEDTGTEETADTEETDTETETTGDPSLNEQLCMDACGVFEECLGGGGLPGCYDDCLEQHDALEGECLGFMQAATSCISGLTCEELDQFLEGEPEPYPCQEEEQNICDEEPCTVDVGMGEEPDECYLEYSCPEEPAYAVSCDANGCSCTIDLEEVAFCDQAIEVCSDLGDFAAINECCGWDL
jgi:hypothetical protein